MPAAGMKHVQCLSYAVPVLQTSCFVSRNEACSVPELCSPCSPDQLFCQQEWSMFSAWVMQSLFSRPVVLSAGMKHVQCLSYAVPVLQTSCFVSRNEACSVPELCSPCSPDQLSSALLSPAPARCSVCVSLFRRVHVFLRVWNRNQVKKITMCMNTYTSVCLYLRLQTHMIY